MSEILIPLYFGQISYWRMMLQLRSVIKHPHMPFQKSSRLNRTVIMTANGPETLTVPVQGGRNTKIPYEEVMIAYAEDWQKNHWNAIQSAYGKSAYWEFYQDKFQTFYNRPYERLIELNEGSAQLIAGILKIDIESNENKQIVLSKEIDALLFETKPNLPSYFQTFSHKYTFVSDLSIVDLILNTGPQAVAYLKSLTTLEGNDSV